MPRPADRKPVALRKVTKFFKIRDYRVGFYRKETDGKGEDLLMKGGRRESAAEERNNS